MHEYSIAQGVRKWTWCVAMSLALGISYGYMLLIEKFPSIEIPAVFESPSLLGVFGVLMFVYDKWLWKVKICGIKLSSIPDYNGTWEGSICSSHNGGSKISCTLEIKQTWSEIVCRLKTDKSCSYSVAASISTEIGPNEGLVWRYVNTPRNNCKADMQMHHGVSRATINNVGELECDYYNCSRERNTCGTIKFRKRV